MLRNLTILGLLLVTGFLVLNNWPSAASAQGEKKAPYVHSVVFYVKKDAPKDATSEMIADCHALLATIPSVKGVWAGRPAEKSSPDFVVKDYSFGLLVLTDDYEGLKGYIDHPTHVKFVEKHIKNIEKVLVYDYMNQAK